jgi:hypothetical protein
MPDTPTGELDADLLAALPLSARRVLELGGAGAVLEAAFRRRAPAVAWTSVAIAPSGTTGPPRGHPEPARRPVVDDLDDGRIPWAAWAGRFDCVVLDDGLARLRDPAAVLARVAACLAPGGVVIARIANPAHWTTVAALLAGRLPPIVDRDRTGPPSPAGFGREQITALFRHAGLAVLKLRACETPRDAPGFEPFLAALAPAARALGVDEAAARARLATRHHVARAIPMARLARGGVARPRFAIHVSALAPDFADVRTKLPLVAFASLPDVDVHYQERRAVLPAYPADQPKVVVVQRSLPEDEAGWRRAVGWMHERGWLVVADWDDHPDLFAPSVRERFDRAPWASVRGADAVQTSTETLARVIRAVRDPDPTGGADRVAVFDNRLLEVPDERDPAGRPDRPPTVLFGALNRTREGLGLATAIAPVLARHPHARVVVVLDRAVFDAIAHPNKVFRPRLDYADWHRQLADSDIALLPLAPSLPNACKSDLKWVECAAHGVACIASPTAYAGSIEDGATGLLADTPQAFAQALARLLDDPVLRRRLGRAAQRRVRDTRLLSAVVEPRLRWYEALWQERFGRTAATATGAAATGTAAAGSTTLPSVR